MKSNLGIILLIVIVVEVVLIGLAGEGSCEYADYCVSDITVPLFVSGPFVVAILLGYLIKSPFVISATSVLHGVIYAFLLFTNNDSDLTIVYIGEIAISFIAIALSMSSLKMNRREKTYY